MFSQKNQNYFLVRSQTLPYELDTVNQEKSPCRIIYTLNVIGSTIITGHSHAHAASGPTTQPGPQTDNIKIHRGLNFKITMHGNISLAMHTSVNVMS